MSPIFQSIAKTITHSRSNNNLDVNSKLFINDDADDKRLMYSNSTKKQYGGLPIILNSDSNYMRTFDERKPEVSKQSHKKEINECKEVEDCKANK